MDYRAKIRQRLIDMMAKSLYGIPNGTEVSRRHADVVMAVIEPLVEDIEQCCICDKLPPELVGPGCCHCIALRSAVGEA